MRCSLQKEHSSVTFVGPEGWHHSIMDAATQGDGHAVDEPFWWLDLSRLAVKSSDVIRSKRNGPIHRVQPVFFRGKVLWDYFVRVILYWRDICSNPNSFIPFTFFALLGQSNPLSRTVSCLTINQLSRRSVWFARTLMKHPSYGKNTTTRNPWQPASCNVFWEQKVSCKFFTMSPQPNKVPTLNPDKIHTAASDIMQHAHVGC